MLKVVLIDDEKWVVKSLKTIVDWQSLGYEIIGEAFNGVEGYEHIKRLTPDLVLTDICMPGMDGLELIRRGNELNKDIGFIVTSGYKEFEYARKAMQYGALAYLLKPFDEVEFAAVLHQYRNKLLKKKAILHMELLNRLQESGSQSDLFLLEIMSRLGYEWDEQIGTVIVVAVGSASLPIRAGEQFLVLQIGRDVRAYIVQGDYIADLKDSLSITIPDDIAGIGISGHVYDLDHLMNAIGEANTAAHQFFITGSKGVWNANSFGGSLDEIMEILWQLNQSRNTELVDELVKKIELLIAECRFSMKNAVSLYNWILLNVYKLEEEQMLTYQQLANRFAHVNDMLSYLKSLLLAHCDRSFETSPPAAPISTFTKILAYIDEHFREDLSLQVVSERLDLHPNYISYLFRKEASDTYLQYVTRKRVSYACKLLKETNLSIQEISENTGYLDYFHFAKAFKKMIGLTASQYREAERGST